MGFLERQGAVELTETVPATSTLTIDEIALEDGHVKTWEITVETAISVKRNFQIVSALEQATVVDWSVYSKMRQGGKIDFDINITSDGTELDLEVTNNEAEDIIVNIVRFQ